MNADPADTLAVLREVREHAGDGALPFGYYIGDGAGGMHTISFVLSSDSSRDLCVGYWLRRLAAWTREIEGFFELMAEDTVHAECGYGRGYTTPGCADPFAALAALILALPADMARRVFARKNGG